jgi:hypothetical protein
VDVVEIEGRLVGFGYMTLATIMSGILPNHGHPGFLKFLTAAAVPQTGRILERNHAGVQPLLTNGPPEPLGLWVAGKYRLGVSKRLLGR